MVNPATIRSWQQRPIDQLKGSHFIRRLHNYDSSYLIFQMVKRFQRRRFFLKHFSQKVQCETISNRNLKLGFTIYIRNSNLTVFFSNRNLLFVVVHLQKIYIYKIPYLYFLYLFTSLYKYLVKHSVSKFQHFCKGIKPWVKNGKKSCKDTIYQYCK